MNYLHSSVTTPMRSGLKQMLRELNASHILTLAFHEQINMTSATKKLSQWHLHVMHRLFGRHCLQQPAEQTIEFILLPEAGDANLHFHGLIRVPTDHLAYFERYALPHWKRIARKGTIDFQQLRTTAEERDKWFNYITKRTLANDFVHSSMLHYFDANPATSKSVGVRPKDSRRIKLDIAKALPEPVPTSTANDIDNH